MESEMHQIQRLAILSAAIALIAAPAVAAPKVTSPGGVGLVIPVQTYRGGFGPGSGVGSFFGGGLGFGGGGYNSWPSGQQRPLYQLPPNDGYQPPVSNAYPTQPQPQPQPQQQAPVASAPPPAEIPAVRRPAVARPVVTPARPVPNAQPNYLATLTGVKGDDVSVRPAGGRFSNVSSGLQLKAADEIASGPDTEVTLTLRDGGTVHMSPATKVNLAALGNDPKNNKAMVNLEIGELASKVSLGATTGYNFGVKTDRAVIDVREATFTVRHDKQTGLTTVSVEQGVVRVAPTNNSLEAVSLLAGQQAQVTADHFEASAAPEQPVDTVPTVPATAPAADTPSGVIPASASAPMAKVVATVPTTRVADAAAGAGTLTVAAASGSVPATPPARLDLTGGWFTQDGRVVQVTQNGTQVSWSYRGEGEHEALTGTVSGTFDGKVLTGTFQYKEGDNGGSGTITLTMDGDSRLVGAWTSTIPSVATGQTVLTRQ